MDIYLLIFGVAFLSALLQTATGFGSAIIMMALFPLFIPADCAVMLSLIFGGLMSAGLLLAYRSSLDLRLFLLPGLFAALGAVAGLFLGAMAAPAVYLRLLGILLFLLSIWFLFLSKRVRIPATPVTGSVVGIVSGVLGAMFSIAGPPLVLYYTAVTDDKGTYMSALQCCLLVLSVVAVSGRAAIGAWPGALWSYLLPCAIGVACGSIPGWLIHKRIDAARLKQIIYIFMCAAGIYIAVSA